MSSALWTSSSTSSAVFFQAEDGIRDYKVTGVQTCALPISFVPQCGLAPGFISIAAAELITHFDALRAVKLRVGALPQHPNNVLKYSLTWSTEGLINEYGNPCQAVSDGRLLEVAPLEGLEEI